MSLDVLHTAALFALIATLSGARLYMLMLALGVWGRFFGLDLPEGLHFLEHSYVIGTTAILTVVELLANKVYLVAHAWEVLQTPFRIFIGAVLSSGVFGDSVTPLTVAAGLLGGTITTGTHMLSAGRVFVMPDPFSHLGIATVEDVLALGGIWLALTHPFAFLVALSFLVALAVWLAPKAWRAARAFWRNVFRFLTGKASAAPVAAVPVAAGDPNWGSGKIALLVLMLGLGATGVLAAINAPGQSARANDLAAVPTSPDSDSLQCGATVSKVRLSDIRPTGGLATVFAPNSRATDLQLARDIGTLKGKVVTWRLPVEQISSSGSGYRIVTSATGDVGRGNEQFVRTAISLRMCSALESSFVEGLKIGEAISIQGLVAGVSDGRLLIDPAIVSNAGPPDPTAPIDSLERATFAFVGSLLPTDSNKTSTTATSEEPNAEARTAGSVNTPTPKDEPRIENASLAAARVAQAEPATAKDEEKNLGTGEPVVKEPPRGCVDVSTGPVPDLRAPLEDAPQQEYDATGFVYSYDGESLLVESNTASPWFFISTKPKPDTPWFEKENLHVGQLIKVVGRYVRNDGFRAQSGASAPVVVFEPSCLEAWSEYRDGYRR